MNTDQLLKREQLAKKICAQLNNFVDLKNILKSIIINLREITDFEAVSIRLHDNGDYPYYVYNGFTESFIQQENSICTVPEKDENGIITLKPRLDCLCGNVISGNIDNSQDYYTLKGSYYTNGSTAVTPLLLKNEKGNNIRNFCNACGYESIGLIPIKAREENIGLIQLNDKRTEMFTGDLVEFLEMIGEQIGVAIENAMLYEKLKQQNSVLQRTVDELNYAHNHLIEAKKMTALADLVTGLNHEIYQPIGDTISLLEKIISETREIENSNGGAKENLARLITEEREIFNSLSNIKNLIKSFRSISLNQFQETRHLFNIRNFFSDVIRIIRPSLTHKNISFQIECNELSEIMSFSGILSQVLTIFIQNADEFAFRNMNHGIITIGCSISDEDNLHIYFCDNGPGIDERIRHKIFEPFFTTDIKNHSGLGLYVATNLVENKLKGKILLDESYKQGAKLIIQIPV